MKRTLLKPFALVFLLLCIGIPVVSGTTITADGGTIAAPGESALFAVTADSLPDGLSGFELTFSISDPAKAEIVNISLPDWGYSEITAVPADSVTVKAVDLYVNYNQSLSDFEMVTLEIRGDETGITELQITNPDIADGEGDNIVPTLVNGTITIGNVTPPIVTGSLYIESNPTLADVKLDGVYKGTSPRLLEDISPGLHTVRVEKTDYYPWEDTVNVNAGETTNVTAALTAIPPPPTTGSLYIESNPILADVKLDGVYKGTSPRLLEDISPGVHTVRLEKTGYIPWENTVTVTAGETTNVTAALTAIPPAPTTGSVNVTSDPTGSDVKLDGILKGTTTLNITGVNPGSHTLRVETAGYIAYTAPVSVTAGETTFVHAILEPVPPVNGTINVTSSPTGADVSLDGDYQEITPLTIPDVSNGIHTLRVEKSGYVPWEEPVIVIAGETSFVHAILTTAPPTTGSVTVQSDPDRANVYLDGNLSGLTAVAILDVTPGPHIIRIEKTDYLPYEKDITVTAGSTTIVSAVLSPVPPPDTGSIDVQSDPDGAYIYVDGVLKDITPSLIPDISPGMHTVAIELTGYETYENSSVSVIAGATTLISALLEPASPPPETGWMELNSTPVSAVVYLDGVLKTTTPLSFANLLPGPYSVRMEAPGYEIWEETVTVTAGETVSVNAVLTPLPTPTPTETGDLSVISYPRGASILIDGKDTGSITNTVVKGVPIGTHLLTLEKTRYTPKTVPVTITEGEETIVVVTLMMEGFHAPSSTTIPTIIPTTIPTTVPTTQPTVTPTIPPSTETGDLSITSYPRGASIIIDGNDTGTRTDTVVKGIPLGIRQLTLEKTNYHPKTLPVTIEAGELTAVHINLIPEWYPIIFY